MNIFKQIEQFSQTLALKIGKNESEDDIELYQYSIFMILSNGFTICSGLLVSLLFGYFLQYILCVLSYVFLRVVAGGTHCDTFKQCYFTSNIIFFICAMFSFICSIYPNISFLVSVFCIINTIPITPKPSENSESRGRSEDLRFRRKCAFKATILLLISAICIPLLPIVTACISSGIIILCLVLTNFGERVISKLGG